MRVLHLTTFLQGGAGRNIADLAIAQLRAGFDVLVVGDAGGEPGYRTYREYIRELDAAGVPFAEVTSTFKRDRALNDLAAAQLRGLLEGWVPDLVHAHAATPGAVARRAGLGIAQPVIHTMHGWGIAKTPEQASADLELLEMAAAVVVPSAAAGRTLREAGLRRTDAQVIPYGLSPHVPSARPDVADVRRVNAIANGRPVCLCVGTIGERKNQRLLMEALSTPGMDAAALFIGDGDASSLEEHGRRAGVADRVVVLGHRPHASRYLALAAVAVLPSRNEGLPLFVLESLRAGVPVVGTDIPEIAEALSGDACGYLFPPDDPVSLASALHAALSAPDDIRTRCRARFDDHYTSSRMFREYGDLYGRLAAVPS
jgi:glycosyltransferase involved in cell wall biosynthesis